METTALIAQGYGQSDVLEFTTLELPPFGVDLARIAVRAAGINPVDARRMTGEFRHGTPPLSFGTEFAGTVVGLNGDAGGWKFGDEVLGSGGTSPMPRSSTYPSPIWSDARRRFPGRSPARWLGPRRPP
jgi:NADPH2:quinone reductase